MSNKKISLILNKVLEKIKPPKEDLEIIDNALKEFMEKFSKKLKSSKINAEIFIGGSFAKNTVIKKDKYDVDIFLRFDKKYPNNEISKLTKKLLVGIRNVAVVHGSRDYFRIKIGPNFFIELIPVIKVKNAKESENITDLSYSHVKYIKRKVKSPQVLEGILLAKAFCYANNCYGAESYIKGFSGYALELLVYSYGNFIKFLRGISKIDPKMKTIIDSEKHYKNKQAVMMDINNSKLVSPIILIDPTYKQRNALAALSEETFIKFQKECKKFLKSPSIKAFEVKKTDLEKIKKNAKKKKFEFILIETKTNRQEGDIAGSKLLKFHKHLNSEIGKFFDIKKKGFNYNNKKSARSFFVTKKKKELLISGPLVKDKNNVKKFKKKHKKTFSKKGKLYAREKINFGLQEFLNNWKKSDRKIMKDMCIKEFKILD